MKKRILAVLLCLCLMIPSMGLSLGQAVSAAEKEYVVADMSVRVSGNFQIASGGNMYTPNAASFSPAINLKEYATDPERPIDTSTLAIQMDLYLSGEEEFVKYFTSGKAGGQIELTSSGTCDKQEIRTSPGKLGFVEDEWVRFLLPLSAFTDRMLGIDGKEFNPEALDYFRMYFANPGSVKGGTSTGTLKVCNMYLVDTSVPESERPDMGDVGDGTFAARKPVWKKIEFSEGYDYGVMQVAGYNLKEYAEMYEDEVTIVDKDGNEDYAPLVNSLLEGLQAAGGGTLFIPAGEYEFRTEIIMPAGTSICGEWQNPDEHPEVYGTILKVYCGKNNAEGSAFISLGAHCLVQNVSFWYPEQSYEEIVPYPPTVRMNQYTYVKNATFVNSYFAVQQNVGANCQNVWDVYGTPLLSGLDFDMTVDIARIQEVHFAPKYWINSNLDGAPTTEEEQNILCSYLYEYATGITLRRIDWSYVTHSDIRGYSTGLLFDISANESNFPNGQCVGMHFEDCQIAIYSNGVSGSAESLTDITIRDCEYGIMLTETSPGLGAGHLQIFNTTIDANDLAIYQNSQVRLSVLSCTIQNGLVTSDNGHLMVSNTKFYTPAPQVVLDYGTCTAILLGNRDARGREIVYENLGLCPMSYDPTLLDINEPTSISAEEAAEKLKGPAKDTVVIPEDLDNNGTEDVTAKLQEYLTAVGNAGGGMVYLKPGKYRIDGTLVVPTGVELRGAGDYASIPKAVNTILQVYTPVESGKNDETSTATITLKENAGIRGIIVNYPEQNQVASTYEKEYVGTNPNKVGTMFKMYKFNFKPYPYTVRGAGKDVYVVNVSIRNGWNGIDLKTNRCDNHYVDYLAGHFFHRGIVVGGGSTNGMVRNFQFNYNSIYQALADVWSGFGGEPSNSEIQHSFHREMQAQFNNNSIILQLGDVNDQIVYNCFNYASYIGVHLVEENGNAPDAKIFGHGVDYGTVSMKIEAAEDVEFVNLQLTAFNQDGSDDDKLAEDNYPDAVDQETNPIYDIWLTESFEGEINITNFTEWAPTPTAALRVDNGTLNIYNSNLSHTKTPLFEMGEKGTLNLVGAAINRGDNPVIAEKNLDRVFFNGGYYQTDPASLEGIGQFDNMYLRTSRWAAPDNVTFDPDSKIVVTESFSDYAFTQTSDFRTIEPDYTVVGGGIANCIVNDMIMDNGLYTGLDLEDPKDAAFALTGGKKDDLYRMELRFNLASLRQTEYSETFFMLYNLAEDSMIAVKFAANGDVLLEDGTKIGNYEIGEWYRLAFEIDARDKNNKTITTYLLDDESNPMFVGPAVRMADEFQGDAAISGFTFMSSADPGDSEAGQTVLQVDYFYVTRSEKSTLGMFGDVDGNGKVTSTDARMVLQYSVNKIEETALAVGMADVDGNGEITSTDARLILQYSVGKIDAWPVAG